MSESLTLARVVSLPTFSDVNGTLIVNAQDEVPIPVSRVFSVHANGGQLRGQHAHFECSQFLIAQTGAIELRLFDGSSSENIRLDSPSFGVLVPPLVWAEQEFLVDGSTLLVLCDRHFSEDDYIREMDRYQQIVLPRT